jgi:hypothetical protein
MFDRLTPHWREGGCRSPQTRGSVNQSPSTFEPVPGVPKRKLKNGEQRLAPQRRQSRPKIPEFADQ